MGLFSFLGGSKVDRLTKKVSNAWVQTVERKRAMEQLADIGDIDALYGLMQRFTFRTEGSIVDEDEKQLGFDLLVACGPAAIPAIEKFVSSSDAVYWPLKALRQIAGADAAVELLLRALDKASQTDARVNEHRTQLVANLRDFPHDEVRDKLLALVEDPSEDIRVMAVDGLVTYGKDVALEPIVGRILDPEESNAVKTVVYEALVEQGWSLEPWRKQIDEADAMPPMYRIGKSGALERT